MPTIQAGPVSFAQPLAARGVRDAYGDGRLAFYAAVSVLVGVAIAGFWNFQLVDGWGRELIAGRTIGDSAELAGGYADRGAAFGFLFAMVAGLAATFTACNCVVFAMLPGLACPVEGGARSRSTLGAFVASVMVVCAAYGVAVGLMGSGAVEAYNDRAVRLPQAQGVFSLVGLLMLGMGALELGFLGARMRLSATSKAAILGGMVGLFAVGRPFPVFRDFLTYVVSAGNPLYTSAAMMIQGVGQILVMLLLLVALMGLGRHRLRRWVIGRPQQVALVNGLLLVGGGAFFVYYWGLAFLFDIGRWGFKLGWY